MPGMKSNQEITGTYNPRVSFWHNFPEIGIKKWIIIASIIFIIGLLVGIFTPGYELFASTDYLEDLSETLGPLSSFGLFIVILIKNIFALLLCFIFSPFLCILPVFSLFINGWLISFVGNIISQEESLAYYLVGILPHGIVEIPALIIGQAAALSLGTMTIAAIFSKEKREALFANLRGNLKYLGIVILLLVVAAIIEAFITPLALGLFD
jgi:stage II sporulation protein M